MRDSVQRENAPRTTAAAELKPMRRPTEATEAGQDEEEERTGEVEESMGEGKRNCAQGEKN